MKEEKTIFKPLAGIEFIFKYNIFSQFYLSGLTVKQTKNEMFLGNAALISKTLNNYCLEKHFI